MGYSDKGEKLADTNIQTQDVGGPVTALALNKSTNQVGVAGRSIFKIYSISEKNGFELVSNLRIVKNVVAGCNDIAWNQVDDNILASATPSGAIVIWNLNKPGFSKMDLVYQDHKRIVNKICFHPSDPWLLASGSQDSIKLFDLRQSEAIINYSALSESIRDLQFSPTKSNVFIAVQDNGYVQLYDIRKKDRFEQSFPAHNGPILACDWHPEQTDFIATAGRDMSIKVWNLTGQTPQMQHCIPTMEAVSKVRWSYDDSSNIASCSLKRDFSINIWDIHRPYIACARFTEPHEITTGMAWRRGVNCLISVTGNGNLYQLPISSAYKPLEHANPVGMAINPDGDIALAIDSSVRQRISSRSQLDVYKCTQMNWFVKTAQEYQLSNRPLAELCDHNAEVCAKLRRFQICQTWKILKLFYANIGTTSNQSTQHVSSSQQASSKQSTTIVAVGGDDLSVNSQPPLESEVSATSRNMIAEQRPKLLSNLSDAITTEDPSVSGSEHSNESTDEWLSHDTISYEAFQHKHDICGRFERLIEHKSLNNQDDSASSSASSNHEEEYAVQSYQNNVENNENDFKISHLVNSKAYQFKFYEIIADVIADVLKYHVDNSDVQSAVSILIVLGDRIKNIVNDRIPEVDRESWYYSYIDLLSKFQLWNVMAQVINLSPLQDINSINQTSTTIYTTCGSCNRPLNGKVSWICDRCKTKPSQCSVCHGVVAGLMAWCQGCYHGGHLIHMSQWFSENDYCPTGCGHICELSQWR